MTIERTPTAWRCMPAFPRRVGAILHERRAVTPDTALRLARVFGTSAEFWLNLQWAHDLSKARLAYEDAILREVQPLPAHTVPARRGHSVA